jgi:nicotinamidase-related amidase
MWDKHWSTGATFRVNILADKINEFCVKGRNKGIKIIHCPSDCKTFYEDRKFEILNKIIPKNINKINLELLPQSPVCAKYGGSDTNSIDEYLPNTPVWKKQNEKIKIEKEDLVYINGLNKLTDLFNYLKQNKIEYLIYVGVHTNMCILHRDFGILNMINLGFKPILVSDLTDSMYDPGQSPYLSHDEGTKLVINWIEKFFCPTTTSESLK